MVWMPRSPTKFAHVPIRKPIMTLSAFRFCLACCIATLGCAAPASSGPQQNELPVTVRNLSEPVLCAEKDNVNVTFSAPDVRQFRIQAVHPAYIGGLVADRATPDFTSCNMASDPFFAADVKEVMLYETPDLWLVGLTYPTFWRPATVPVRVGDRVETGLHLVQLWMRHNGKAEEVLVVYPPDGYWRARPLPPGHLTWSAYGSSFIVGPVEVQQRPIVDLKSIEFDPARRAFTLAFARGGSATLTLDAIDQDHAVLDVRLDDPPPNNYPFAALRSMYVTGFNADVAQVAWRTAAGRSWEEMPIMGFKGAEAVEFWAGRTMPSRHNTSAPDMVFGKFSKGLAAD
jgi:hypothetical protein